MADTGSTGPQELAGSCLEKLLVAVALHKLDKVVEEQG